MLSALPPKADMRELASKCLLWAVEALDDIDYRLAGAIDVTTQAVARIESLFANSIPKP